MTGRARKDMVISGSGRVQPRAWAASVRASTWSRTSSRGLSDINPAMGSGQAALYLTAGDDHLAAPHVGDGRHGRPHFVVVDADDDDVVRVVGHAGGDGAPLEAHALDQAQAHIAGAMVPLDDGHLEQVAVRVCDDVPIVCGRRQAQVLGDDLVGDGADDARRALASRDGKIEGRGGKVYAGLNGNMGPVGCGGEVLLLPWPPAGQQRTPG